MPPLATVFALTFCQQQAAIRYGAAR
jgi:hypothetical protein